MNKQKRFLSMTPQEMVHLNKDNLLLSLKHSEGRIVVAECLATQGTYLPNMTNAEIARAFGADLILLNLVDLFNFHIDGISPCENPLQQLKKFTARPIGLNLEPVDENFNLDTKQENVDLGRLVTKETLTRANEFGFDFICLTGNPSTGVSQKSIIHAIKLAKQYFHGVIFAGKMHSSGIDEPLFDPTSVSQFIEAGADVILLPAVGTVRGATVENCQKLCDLIRSYGKLSLATIGTSQETSQTSTIEQIALANKMAGFDLHHIGDAGPGGIAIPENIMALSIAVRGKRHTFSMMAQSINR